MTEPTLVYLASVDGTASLQSCGGQTAQYHLRTVLLRHGPHRHLTDRCAFHNMMIPLQGIARRSEMRTFQRISLQIQRLPKNLMYLETGMASQEVKHHRIQIQLGVAIGFHRIPSSISIHLPLGPQRQLRCLTSQSLHFRHLRTLQARTVRTRATQRIILNLRSGTIGVLGEGELLKQIQAHKLMMACPAPIGPVGTPTRL